MESSKLNKTFGELRKGYKCLKRLQIRISVFFINFRFEHLKSIIFFWFFGLCFFDFFVFGLGLGLVWFWVG